MKEKNYIKIAIKIALIIIATITYAIGIKWFVYNGGIIPGGATGLAILIQRILLKTLKLQLPLTVISLALNIIPAIYAYKIIGKQFTIFSFIIMFAMTFLTDILPVNEITTTPMLCSIFGGFLCGIAAVILYRCGVSTGGTDFIAMSLSTKYNIRTFEYVMAFNILLILIQGFTDSFDAALYSIIYQFTNNQVINTFYRHYEARTIFIITNKPDEISDMFIQSSTHSITKLDGTGAYTKKKKSMLYVVVTQPEVRKFSELIKRIDPDAFVNIMQSNEIQGNFKYLPINSSISSDIEN